jgi:hypothetical protein
MSAVGGVVARRARVSLAIAAISAIIGLVVTPVHGATRSTLSVLVPIVAAANEGGLLTADELSAGTSPSGSWAQLSRAAQVHGATIALDSRIVASITELGDEAPNSAVEWLESVTRSNPLYLPWGNADPFLLASVGRSFRVSAIQLSEISGIPAASITGWPTGSAGNAKSIDVATRLGYSAFFVDDVTFPDTTNSYSRSLSDTVAEAVSTGSTVDVGEVAAQVRGDAHGDARFALPRNPDNLDVGRAVDFLDALFAGSTKSTKFEPVPLTDLGPPTLDVHSANAIRQLMFQHRLDRRVASIAVDPKVITTPRLRQLAALTGRVADSDFPTFVRAYVRQANDYSEFVSFSIGSDFTVLANATELPLTLVNLTSTDITVVATVVATSGIVSIAQSDYTVTIPAESNAQVVVPMSSVANGKTSIRATLQTTSGIPISDPVYVEIDVQAQWEGVTLVSFIVLVSLIMGIGIARTIRDRRRTP